MLQQQLELVRERSMSLDGGGGGRPGQPQHLEPIQLPDGPPPLVTGGNGGGPEPSKPFSDPPDHNKSATSLSLSELLLQNHSEPYDGGSSSISQHVTHCKAHSGIHNEVAGSSAPDGSLVMTSFTVSHFSAVSTLAGHGEPPSYHQLGSEIEAPQHSLQERMPTDMQRQSSGTRLEDSLAEDSRSHGWIKISVMPTHDSSATSGDPKDGRGRGGDDDQPQGGVDSCPAKTFNGPKGPPVIARQAHFAVQDVLTSGSAAAAAAPKRLPDEATLVTRAKEFDRAWDAVVERLMVEGQIMGSRPSAWSD